jgi:hypothetical protein
MARSLRPARLAGPRAGALILLALGVAGCGTVIQNAAGTASATGPASAAGSAGSASSAGSRPASAAPASRQLCAQPGAVSKLIIARAGVLRVPVITGRAGLSGSPSAPPVPSPSVSEPVMVPRPLVVRVVTSPPRTQVLARALCALPRAPRGPVNCPAFYLGYYRLTFTADGRTLTPVTVQVSGCQLVTGPGGPVRRATPAFWNLLARTGGWPPTWPVHLPGGPLPPPPGSLGCSAPGSRTSPDPGGRECPGPYHPVTRPRQ